MNRLPSRFRHPLYALLLSGLMSSLVSGVSTWNAIGVFDGFADTWLSAWLHSWAVAFPAVMGVAPLVRWIVEKLVTLDD